jgi:hypothetical protein
MILTNIDWIAVILGAILNMILGSLWYGVFFGKKWLTLMEKSKEDFEGGNGSIYIITFAAALVSAALLSFIINGLGISTWYGGLITGSVLWLGFGAAATLTISLYEDRKISLWVLFGLYQLIIFAVQGLAFAIW